MADNDAELEIGVKLDETQFAGSFQHFLSSLKGDTVKALQDAFDSIKGSAAKNWSTLPFSTMHQASSGAQSAAQAFVPGFAQDLKDLGIRKGSQKYEAALMSAIYKSSVPDPTQRQNLLLSYGQNAPTPGSDIEHVLSTDYSLMSMPWSRAFFSVHKRQGLKADDLKGLNIKQLRDKAEALAVGLKSRMRKQEIIDTLVSETSKPSVDVDFAGMREYAVEHGIGRWTDKEHTAKNFELIKDELEDIDENSNKSDKTFRSWNDTLKGVLGTLTAIGGLAAALGGAAVTGTKKSIEGTTEGGTTLNRRRAFIGMSAIDELSAQVASQAIGLGKDTITNEIMTLSSNRQKYKLLGQGLDALYPSLTGIFDNIMTIEDPMEMYKSILTEVYGAMKSANPSTRASTLMLLESQGLGAVADIVGSMISNEAFAKKLGYDPTKLFSLENNPYYGAYGNTEAMLPDLTKLKQSINASYTEMFNTWTDAFGEPFMGWWDNFLKNKIVPFFGDTVKNVKDTLFPDEEKKTFNTALSEVLDQMKELNSVPNTEAQAQAWTIAGAKATAGRSTTISMPAGALKTKAGWWDVFGLGVSPDDLAQGALNTSEDSKTFLRALETIANPDAYNKNALETETTRDIMWRAQAAVNWLKRTGYYSDLAEGGVGSEKNAATMNVVRAYINGEILAGRESATPTEVLDTYLTETMLQSPGWQAMEEFFNTWGEYLRTNPERLMEVELKFTGELAPYIEAKVKGNNGVKDRAY